jgi:hypothetical protein
VFTRAQAGGQAPHPLGEFGMAQRAGVVDEGGLGGAAGVQREQVLGEVEGFRRRGDARDLGRLRHGMSPQARWARAAVLAWTAARR